MPSSKEAECREQRIRLSRFQKKLPRIDLESKEFERLLGNLEAVTLWYDLQRERVGFGVAKKGDPAPYAVKSHLQLSRGECRPGSG